jgi:hypothetical protein
MKRYAIALAVDDHMLPPAAFLAGRLHAANPRSDVDVILFCDNDPALEELAKADFPATVRNIADLLPELAPLRAAGASSLSPYYRFLVLLALKSEYDRVLYLDADLDFRNDSLFSLFDIDMCGAPVAAARDVIISFSRRRRNVEYRHSLSAGNRYLNAGVLLVDSERFAASGLWEEIRSLTIASLGRLWHLDQTALNVALGGNWCELSPALNLFADLEGTFVGRAYPPTIVHHVGSAKPWRDLKYFGDRRIQDELRAYVAKSPWPEFFRRSRTRRDQTKYFFMGPVVSLRLEPLRRFYGLLATRYVRLDKMDRQGLRRYLVETDFADVAAGLTRPQLRYLGGKH